MWKAPLARALMTLTVLGFLTFFVISSLPELKVIPEPSPTLIQSPSAYEDGHIDSLLEQLLFRIKVQPFNLVAAMFFALAILHTFAAHKFTEISHKLSERHRLSVQKKLERLGGDRSNPFYENLEKSVSFPAEICHFLGEVEIIFMIWVIPLTMAMAFFYGWDSFLDYIDHRNYIEPLFVVVIMTLAATRPILQFAERCLDFLAQLGGGSLAAWWLVLLAIGPIMGSFITEPAAMTICALLLSKKFYQHGPSLAFSYATLGLLFVNISVGGTLTHFAAPPVLMVASSWEWDSAFMLTQFGWKATLGILLATAVYFIWFRQEFHAMEKNREQQENESRARPTVPVPAWITAVHVALLAWTVFNSHHPAVFIGSFIFFLGFYQATAPHQSYMTLKAPLLVGSFLAGLVIHGGLQGWWIAPILGSLNDWILMKIAIILTAFNDNAAITYLTTLIPNLGDGAKYGVVAGAVTGGGLTVIANAPNPAGQSLLKKYFPDGVSALYLALSALLPTLIMFLAFRYLPS